MEECEEPGALRLGDEDRRQAREGQGVRRLGEEDGWHPLRDVARRDGVRPADLQTQ